MLSQGQRGSRRCLATGRSDLKGPAHRAVVTIRLSTEHARWAGAAVASACTKAELEEQERRVREGRSEKRRGSPTHGGLITEGMGDSQSHLDTAIVGEEGVAHG